MSKTTEIISILVVVILAGLLIAFTPLAIIWALNTLFGLGIAYNFWSWLAVVVLNLTWAYKPALKLNKQ